MIHSNQSVFVFARRIHSFQFSRYITHYAFMFIVQEVGQFQNRLNRNMAECQEKARDMMTPGMEKDARKMAKVENTLINCMAKTVDEHIALLNPMKDRITAALKQFK